jgi:hypothetical protein
LARILNGWRLGISCVLRVAFDNPQEQKRQPILDMPQQYSAHMALTRRQYSLNGSFVTNHVSISLQEMYPAGRCATSALLAFSNIFAIAAFASVVRALRLTSSLVKKKDRPSNERTISPSGRLSAFAFASVSDISGFSTDCSSQRIEFIYQDSEIGRQTVSHRVPVIVVLLHDEPTLRASQRLNAQQELGLSGGFDFTVDFRPRPPLLYHARV